MNKVVMLLTLLIVFFIMIPDDADARHKNQDTICNINLKSYVFPIQYNGEMRGNPDNTFYPGDGFHYLFTFSGSDTCQEFVVHAIKSEGAFDLQSHHIMMGSASSTKRIHSHNDLDVLPKHLTTKHYYIDRITYPGGIATKIKAEIPSFSIREDQEASGALSRLLEGSRTASTYSLRTKETQSWGFANIGTDHKHGIDEHVYEDTSSIDSFEESVKNTCSKLGKNKGCVFGHAEIDTGIVKTKCLLAELAKMKVIHNLKKDEDVCVNVNDQITLIVKGIKMACSDRECKAVIVKKIAKIKPAILEPNLGVNLLKDPLPDTGGYDAKNLDGTYYLHDPLGIIHQPEFKWKDVRSKTIQFKTEKTYDLKKEYDSDCIENSCDLFLESPGVKPHTVKLGNGDGITIYNATSDEFLGNHEFDYSVLVYNIDRKLDYISASTDALVVKYDPVYTSYPYPRIADDQRFAWDDRQAAALHYFGSNGGGPDDDSGTHQERRSKINDFYQAGFMYDPWNLTLINQTFAWSDADNSGIIPEIFTLDLDIIPAKEENSQVIPFESNENDAMFIKSGYGKVFFEYPLSPIIFDSGTGSPKYENATSYVTLQSSDFAGKKTTYLTFWEFMAPEASFVTDLTVKTVDQNGSITDKPIHVIAVPKLENGAAYLTDYMDEKITYDSKDEGLAQVVVDDAYPMAFDYSGNGMINEKLRRIASQFQEFKNISFDTDSDAEGIFKLSADYLKESKKLRLEIPLDVGLGAPSPTYLVVSANGKTKTIDAQFIDFGTNKEILINVEDDNILETSRGLGFLIISHDVNFGGIKKISVNGQTLKTACLTGCTIPVDKTSSLQVTAWNEWGGTTHTELPEYVITEPPKTPFNQLNPILGLLMLLPAAYIVYRKLKPKK